MILCLLVICHRNLGYSIWDQPECRGNKLSRNVGDYQPTQRHAQKTSVFISDTIKAPSDIVLLFWFVCVHMVHSSQGLTLIPVLSLGTGWEDRVSLAGEQFDIT